MNIQTPSARRRLATLVASGYIVAVKQAFLVVARGFTRSRPAKLIAYWSLAFKLAIDETLRKGGPHPADVQIARRLHRDLYGETAGG